MKQKILEKLREELKVRNLRLIFPHVIVLLITTFYLREQKVIFAFCAGIMLTLALRVFFVRYFFNTRSFENIFAFLVGVVGILWGGVFSFTLDTFGLYSVETLIILGVVFTLLTGGVTVFSSSKKVAITHLVSLSAVPIVKLFILEGDNFFILSILMFVNLSYQVYHTWLANELIKKNIGNELLALSQKQTIQQFIDAIPGLVTVLDSEKNYILVNNYSEGFYKEKLSGKKLGSLFPESGITALINEFYNSSELSKVQEVRSMDLGSENWFMVNLKKITEPRNGVIVAILPINELVQAKNDLKIQEARSKYAAKLASLGELSAGIAHEVNNPLTIIEGGASLMKMMLKEEPLDHTSLEKSVQKILDTTQRIGRIIKSLKTLAGEAPDEPFQNIRFKSIIEPSLEISKSRIVQQNIVLTVQNLDSDVELFGNEVQLSQVIMNLIANAIDAVKDLEGEKKIVINYDPSYEWLDILISDNGHGVNADIRDKIMEPFFTTKEANQGTGLGLSISRSIVDSHEGKLELIEGPMTTFRIRLPRMTPWKDSKKTTVEDTAAVL